MRAAVGYCVDRARGRSVEVEIWQIDDQSSTIKGVCGSAVWENGIEHDVPDTLCGITRNGLGRRRPHQGRTMNVSEYDLRSLEDALLPNGLLCDHWPHSKRRTM